MNPEIEAETVEALIILTGLTADKARKSHVLAYYRDNSHYKVFLPELCQYFGIRGAARLLRGFFRRHQMHCFKRCHFICYISGGFILRSALAAYPLPNVGRIVYVRSPFQERVPALAIHKYGRLPAMLVHGRMLFDLAADWINELPEIQAETGLVIEQGISALGLELGLKQADFEFYRNSPSFSNPATREILAYPLSHDQVYSDDGLLKNIAAFIESGRFRV